MAVANARQTEQLGGGVSKEPGTEISSAISGAHDEAYGHGVAELQSCMVDLFDKQYIPVRALLTSYGRFVTVARSAHKEVVERLGKLIETRVTKDSIDDHLWSQVGSEWAGVCVRRLHEDFLRFFDPQGTVHGRSIPGELEWHATVNQVKLDYTKLEGDLRHSARASIALAVEIAKEKAHQLRLVVNETAQFTCVRCGKMSPTAFAIGPGDRALCPGCQEAVKKASINLSEGMIEPLAVGARLGQFILQEQCGFGNFGEVWKALDEKLGRTVALKFPTLQKGETLDRLNLEAQAVAKLDHPNIVGIHSIETENARQFIVMKFIQGVTLDKYPATNVREKVRVIRDVTRAVHYAHEQKVIHRDLKPENVIVDASVTPFVTDFGLARLLGRSTRLSSTGQFVGTPAYASPEQEERNEVDGRADIYALGVILYELICGSLPPRTGMIQWTPLASELPGIEAVIAKCLEKDPAQRYATALDLARALDAVLNGTVVSGSALGVTIPREHSPQVQAYAAMPASSMESKSLPGELNRCDWPGETVSSIIQRHFRGEFPECPVDDAALNIQEVPTMGKRTVALLIHCPNCGKSATYSGRDQEILLTSEELGVIRQSYFSRGRAACPRDGSLLNVNEARGMGSTPATILAQCPYCGAYGTGK